MFSDTPCIQKAPPFTNLERRRPLFLPLPCLFVSCVPRLTYTPSWKAQRTSGGFSWPSLCFKVKGFCLCYSLCSGLKPQTETFNSFFIVMNKGVQNFLLMEHNRSCVDILIKAIIAVRFFFVFDLIFDINMSFMLKITGVSPR